MVSVTDAVDTSDTTARLNIAIRSEIARDEMDRLSRRVNRGKAGRPADRCCALHGADGRVHHVEVGKQSLVSLSDAPVGVTGEEPKSAHVAMVSCGAEW